MNASLGFTQLQPSPGSLRERTRSYKAILASPLAVVLIIHCNRKVTVKTNNLLCSSGRQKVCPEGSSSDGGWAPCHYSNLKKENKLITWSLVDDVGVRIEFYLDSELGIGKNLSPEDH